ncbi:MAG: hypothetical protein ACYC1I_05445 [Acidimicrobiales bacterium]
MATRQCELVVDTRADRGDGTFDHQTTVCARPLHLVETPIVFEMETCIEPGAEQS